MRGKTTHHRSKGRRFSWAVAMMLASAAVASGAAQGPGLEELRKQYASSLERWAAVDTAVGKQRAPSPAAMVELVEKAAAARNEADEKLAGYLTELRAAYAAAAARVRGTVGSRGDATASIVSADAELLADVDAAISALDTEIKRVTTSDRVKLASAQSQKTDLLEIKNVILRRGREVERAKAAWEEAWLRRERVAAAYDQLEKWTADVAEKMKAEGEKWQRHYSSLKEANRIQRTGPSPTETASQANRESVAAAPETPAQIPTTDAYAVVPAIGGAWVLNNPQARKLPDGSYEPSSVRLDVVQNGAEIQGTYECTYAVPAKEKFNPVVRFNFSGRITNPILRFSISDPLRGSILLRRVNAGVLEVSYGIENPSRTGIDFGLLPETGPQVLRKLIR